MSINDLIAWLSGKKTYIVALGMIVYAAINWWNSPLTDGHHTNDEQQVLVNAILAALGLGALRAGVAKNAPVLAKSKAAKILLLCGLSGFAFGCQNLAALNDTVIATDAGTVTTTTLVTTHNITPADALPVLASVKVVQADLTTWASAVAAGNTNDIAIAQNSTLAALSALQVELNLFKNKLSGTGALKLHVSQLKTDKVVDIGSIIAIIQLVDVLAPQITAWINGATAGSPTLVQVQANLSKLETDIEALQALIAPAPVPASAPARR